MSTDGNFDGGESGMGLGTGIGGGCGSSHGQTLQGIEIVEEGIDELKRLALTKHEEKRKRWTSLVE